tara:strand:- start:35 stop:472 length:438 start_codon:yes stop_codon:yes gene_type:complete
MNSKNTINKIFSKFTEDKTTNLKTHKIELALVDDIKRELKILKDNSSLMERRRAAIKTKGEEVFKLKSGVNDLMKDGESDINYASQNLGDVSKLKEKIAKSAKELGMKPKDIKGFAELDKEMKNIKEAAKELKGKIVETKKLLRS